MNDHLDLQEPKALKTAVSSSESEGEALAKSCRNAPMLFEKMSDLVQHTDNLIASYHKYYLTALGLLVPLSAALAGLEFHWIVPWGLALLAVVLGIHWASVSTTLTLQKLCWTGELRKLETGLFSVGMGPFSTQKSFFDKVGRSEGGGVRLLDKVLVTQFRASYFKFIPIVLLVGILFFMLIGLPALQQWLIE